MSFARYPRYNEIGIKWFGRLPEHWEVARLGTLCTKIGSGKTPHGGADNYYTDGVLFLRSQNVHDEGLRLEDVVFITPDMDAEMSGTRVERGDVLLNITGASLGRTCLVPDDFGAANVNQHVCIIRLKNTSLRHFVSLAMKAASTKGQIESAQTGAARDGLNFQQIARLTLALPPAHEREAIAAFLDRETAKIDALVAEQQRLVELLREKRQAVISHAVIKGLNAATRMKGSGVEWLGTVPVHWSVVPLRSLYRFVKRQNGDTLDVLSVYRDYGVIPKSSRDDNINKTPEDLSSYQTVHPGDLVVNKMKAWQGSLGISDVEGITSPDYAVFQPQHDADHHYLNWLLRCSLLPDVYRSISNGIRPDQWRLEPDRFKELKVPYPPLPEQREIAARLCSLVRENEELSVQASIAIDLLQERRFALISAAITGKIDVREAVGDALETVS